MTSAIMVITSIPAVSVHDRLSGEEIVLVVQNDRQQLVHVRTYTDAPFKKLFAKYRGYALEKGWIEEATVLQFMLDGELIRPEETPSSLDCEGEDRIDVVCK